MLLVLHLNEMTSIPALCPSKKEGWEFMRVVRRQGGERHWWVGAWGGHSTGAVISKNTCFSDCFTKAVCVESGGARMRASLLTRAAAQLSFNPLREDLSKLKLAGRSLKCPFFFSFYYSTAFWDATLKTSTVKKKK